MQALALTGKGKIEIIEKALPKLEAGEVLVKLNAAALNKRDQFIREGKYPNIKIGATLGSDGAGIVEKVAGSGGKDWEGKQVVINPNIGWGDDDKVQEREYSILGMPVDGALAEYVKVKIDRLVEKPGFLSWEEAAAYPLGGLTAYRALFHHGKVQPGENVLISGFGGGVAQFAFQYAVTAGAQVYVTSGKEEKRNKAMELGAAGAFDYNDPDWYKNPWQTKGGFDVVIDSAGGDQINNFLKIMRPAGRIVFYGATNGRPSSIDLYRMFWNQITLQGSTMGNDKEFNEMLSFISKHKIKPILDSVRPFKDVISAFDDIATTSKLGKLVVQF